MTVGQERKKWELAGLLDASGQGFYRPWTSGGILIPESVILKKTGKLYWRRSHKFEYCNPDRSMFDEFVRLSDATPRQICDYARKFGMLEICKHGYPASHNSSTWPRTWFYPPPLLNKTPSDPCQPMAYQNQGQYEEGEEPIDRWRYFAKHARAVLNIASALHTGTKVESVGWRILWAEYERDWAGFGQAPWESEEVEKHRRFLAYVVNDWLQLGAVRPELEWKTRSEPSFAVGGPNLFSHLAMQLCLIVSRTNELMLCSSCGTPYLPTERRPKPNQRHYCVTCRENGVPERDASRDYRQRKIRSSYSQSIKENKRRHGHGS